MPYDRIVKRDLKLGRKNTKILNYIDYRFFFRLQQPLDYSKRSTGGIKDKQCQ